MYIVFIVVFIIIIIITTYGPQRILAYVRSKLLNIESNSGAIEATISKSNEEEKGDSSKKMNELDGYNKAIQDSSTKMVVQLEFF